MLPFYAGKDPSALLASRRRRDRAGAGASGAARLQALVAALLLAVLVLIALQLRAPAAPAAPGLAAIPGRSKGGGGGGAGGRRGAAGQAAAAGAPAAAGLRALVLVACHSVFTGTTFSAAAADDPSAWALLDYQKRAPGQAASFLEHARLGVEAAAGDPEALLLFSGGATRASAGPRAEAAGYWLLAEAEGWFGHGSAVRARAFTEERARDSFENLLFGLCRFRELTGGYPERVVVVSYEFKRRRFAELHALALRWPPARLAFAGTPALDAAAAEAGEAGAAAAFAADPFGCAGELAAKRAARDPFAVGGYGAASCPEIGALLERCAAGAGALRAALPWDPPPPPTRARR
jgi:hypothetical protein